MHVTDSQVPQLPQLPPGVECTIKLLSLPPLPLHLVERQSSSQMTDDKCPPTTKRYESVGHMVADNIVSRVAGPN